MSKIHTLHPRSTWTTNWLCDTWHIFSWKSTVLRVNQTQPAPQYLYAGRDFKFVTISFYLPCINQVQHIRQRDSIQHNLYLQTTYILDAESKVN